MLGSPNHAPLRPSPRARRRPRRPVGPRPHRTRAAAPRSRSRRRGAGSCARRRRFVATAPSAVRRATLTLPVTTAAIGRDGDGRHAGVLQLRRGRGARARRLTLTGLRTRFGRRAETTGLLGARRVRVLTYGRARPGSTPPRGPSGSPPRPSSPGGWPARSGRLRLRRLRSRRLGRVALALGGAPTSSRWHPRRAPRRARRAGARRQPRRRRDDLAAARVVRPLHQQRGRAHHGLRRRDRRAERGAARQRRPARVLVRPALRRRNADARRPRSPSPAP